VSLARIALVVVSLATALTVAGAEDGATPGPSPQQPAVEPNGATPDSTPAPVPAGGFTPSERIGADSAVSFPVDI